MISKMNKVGSVSKIGAIVFCLFFLFSCTRRHKSDNLHYHQDFEAIKGWHQIQSLSSDIKAHSGTYSILVKPSDYSFGFASSQALISPKPLTKIKASVWCYSEAKNPVGAFCIQIASPANENKLFVGKAFEDVLKTEKKWTKLVYETEIPKAAIGPDFSVKVFLWNTGQVPVYGDDMEIEFSE
jgi:hypothetical protein